MTIQIERIREDQELKGIYTTQNLTPYIYHLFPQENATRIGGMAVKSLYTKEGKLSALKGA